MPLGREAYSRSEAGVAQASATPAGSAAAMPGAIAPPDADLVRAAAQGELSAFEGLVQRHHQSLYAFLFRITLHQHDAEDLTQETFVAAFRALHRFDARYAFKTWLYTIGRRLAISAHRRRCASVIADAAVPDVLDPAPSAADGVLVAESTGALRQALATLPSAYQQGLWLFHVDELSVREVAAVLEKTSLGTRVLLHRARRSLARALHRQSAGPAAQALVVPRLVSAMAEGDE